MPLNGTDYVEFYVGNAKQSAYYYINAFGFQPLAYAGLETGMKDRASYVLQQDKIRIVLTTSLQADSEISKHVQKHGDGVKVIALTGKPGSLLESLADVCICAPGGDFADRVQELHIKVLHILIELIERKLSPQNYA